MSNDSSPEARTAGPSISDVREHLDHALVEAEIADSAGDAAIFDQECAVARHSGEDFFVRIDFADIPQARNQHAALGRGDHFVDRLVSPAPHQIHRRFAVFVRERKSMAGRLGFHLLRGGARVDQIFRHAAIDQQDFLPGNAFAIEGLAKLQRMVNVVP